MTILRDSRVLALGVTSCFFEGAMYLFIFFWSAALKSARAKGARTRISRSESSFPLHVRHDGRLGILLLYTAQHTRESTSTLLMGITLLASACLSAAALLEIESVLFWVLCIIEACIGAYFPSMSFLKSEVVEDGVRGGCTASCVSH